MKLLTCILWIPKQVLSVVYSFQTLLAFACREFAWCGIFTSGMGTLHFTFFGCPDIFCPITKYSPSVFIKLPGTGFVLLDTPFIPAFWPFFSELHSNSCNNQCPVMFRSSFWSVCWGLSQGPATHHFLYQSFSLFCFKFVWVSMSRSHDVWCKGSSGAVYVCSGTAETHAEDQC